MSATPPSGLGIFLWIWKDCDGGDLPTILGRCAACNISWVALHFPDVTADRVQAFHDAGIYVAAWWYCVPGSAETETFITSAVNMRKLGVDAILPDCEIEWESRNGAPADRRPEALIFAQKLRNALGPDCFIGNCGAWQWPDAHGLYPDHAFGNYWSAGLPERYWTMFSPSHSPKSVLDESDRQWADKENVNAYKSLIPIGSAFDGVAQGGQALRPEDVAAFLDRQETCALWSWQHVPSAVWALLERRAASTASTEPPPVS
jgi:hypothetical protein